LFYLPVPPDRRTPRPASNREQDLKLELKDIPLESLSIEKVNRKPGPWLCFTAAIALTATVVCGRIGY
jgi:hypothetical protein